MPSEENIRSGSPTPPPAAALRPEAFAPDLSDVERGFSEPDAREIADRRHVWGLWSAVEDLYSARRGRAIVDSNIGTDHMLMAGFGTVTGQDSDNSGMWPDPQRHLQYLSTELL
jgi:hypothetical protein